MNVKKFLIRNHKLINIEIFLGIYLGWLITHNYGTFYTDAIQQLAIERIHFPTIWFLGIFLNELAGLYGLFIFAFVWFLVAIMYMFKTLKAYPFFCYFLSFFLFMRPGAANWFMFFGRDNLIIGFASIFTYYFMLTWLKKENHFLIMSVLAILALYTKTSGFLLIMFLVILFIKNNHNAIFNNAYIYIPLFKDSWLYSAWYHDLEKVAVALFRLTDLSPVFLFTNKVFYLSFLTLIISRGVIPFTVLTITLFTGLVIHNISTVFYGFEEIWRYTYILIPINLLVIAEVFKQRRRNI